MGTRAGETKRRAPPKIRIRKVQGEIPVPWRVVQEGQLWISPLKGEKEAIELAGRHQGVSIVKYFPYRQVVEVFILEPDQTRLRTLAILEIATWEIHLVPWVTATRWLGGYLIEAARAVRNLSILALNAEKHPHVLDQSRKS